MKFFATALLASATQAAKLNDGYEPHTIIEQVVSYEQVPVTRYRKEARKSYDIEQEIRQR